MTGVRLAAPGLSSATPAWDGFPCLAAWLEANWPEKSRKEVLSWPAEAAELSVDERLLFERLEFVRQGLCANADRPIVVPQPEELSQVLAKWLDINRRSSAVVVLS